MTELQIGASEYNCKGTEIWVEVMIALKDNINEDIS